MVSNAECLNDIKAQLDELKDAEFSGKFRDDVESIEAEIERLHADIESGSDIHIPSFDSSKVTAEKLGVCLPQLGNERYYPKGAKVEDGEVLVPEERAVVPEERAVVHGGGGSGSKNSEEASGGFTKNDSLTQDRQKVLNEVGDKTAAILQALKGFEYHLVNRARENAKKTQKLAASYGVKLPWHVFVRLNETDYKVIAQPSKDESSAFVSEVLHSALTKLKDLLSENENLEDGAALLAIHLRQLQAPCAPAVAEKDIQQAKALSEYFVNVLGERSVKENTLSDAEKVLADNESPYESLKTAVDTARTALEDFDKSVQNKLSLRAKLIELTTRVEGAEKYTQMLEQSRSATKFQFAKNFLFEGRAITRPVIALAVAGIATAAGALLASAVASSVAYSVATSLAAYAVSRSYVIYQTASRLNVKSHELPQTEMPSQSPLLEAAALAVPASVFVLAPYALAASIASRVALYTQFSARVLMSSVASLYSAFSTRTELNTMMTNVHLRAGSEVTANDLKPLAECFKALSSESQTKVQETFEKGAVFDLDKSMALNVLIQLSKAVKSLDVEVTKTDDFRPFQTELDRTISTATARAIPVLS